MAFNTDIFGSCDGLLICIASWLNEITFGIFWSLFLAAFMIVLFMGSYRYGTNRAFGFAGTVGIFGALGFGSIGLIPKSISVLFFLAGAISIAILYLSNKE